MSCGNKRLKTYQYSTISLVHSSLPKQLYLISQLELVFSSIGNCPTRFNSRKLVISLRLPVDNMSIRATSQAHCSIFVYTLSWQSQNELAHPNLFLLFNISPLIPFRWWIFDINASRESVVSLKRRGSSPVNGTGFTPLWQVKMARISRGLRIDWLICCKRPIGVAAITDQCLRSQSIARCTVRHAPRRGPACLPTRQPRCTN